MISEAVPWHLKAQGISRLLPVSKILQAEKRIVVRPDSWYDETR